MNGRERVFSMFRGHQVDRLPLMPITMQFASDFLGRRYGEYVRDFQVLVEAQLRVAEAFSFDHVSCISDPAREAADCGACITYFDNSPPALNHENALLADKTKLAILKKPSPVNGGRMHDRIKAAELFSKKVQKERVVEGWIEGPLAEAANLRGLSTIMLDFFEDPGFVKDLLAFTLDLGLDFAKAQIQAGVDVVGIGDSVCSLIGPALYKEFAWPYEKKLIEEIHKLGAAVRLHICGNIKDLLEDIKLLGCDFCDIDAPVSLREARQKLGKSQIIAGNLDPVSVLQRGTPDQVYQTLTQCHAHAGDRFIIAAGCEITRDTPFENLRVLTAYAQSHSVRRHRITSLNGPKKRGSHQIRIEKTTSSPMNARETEL